MAAVIPIVAPVGFVTHVMDKSGPAFAVGSPVTTVTTTLSVAVQPLAVFVEINVYVVVTDGFAVGLAINGSLKLVIGDQE